jgi:NADPH-dependent curcumin reductase
LLIKLLYISVDAAMRVWINGVRTYIDGIKPGDVMKGSCVSEVLESGSKKYKKGDLIQGFFDLKKF